MLQDVLTFGEAMLRFSPSSCLRLGQANAWDVWVAGSEANVAAALAALGLSATWASRLPDTLLGRKVADELRGLGVDVSAVVWTSPEERLGVFYMEPEAPPRPAAVIYDRANSAASRLTPADLPDSLFDRHRHLHVSGITVALSSSCAETVADAVRRAKARGLTISLDVNYRAKLWPPDAARAALAPLLSQVDIVFCACADAARVFGLSGDVSAMARRLREQWDVPCVALTAGADGAVCADNDGVRSQPAIPVSVTVERLGSGDAFAAGFLAGYLSGFVTDGLKLGVAAAALKRTIPGDLLRATRAEIDALLALEPTASWR